MQVDMEQPSLLPTDLESKQRGVHTYLNPNHWLYLTILLSLSCYVQFFSFYCFEAPGGLEDTIIKVMGIDTTQYNLLFLVTTWPNVLVSIIGGVIADRILGPRSSFIALLLITMLGKLMWSLGSFINLLWVVLIGRFFIGIGAALIPGVNNIFFISWFGKGYLTLAISIAGTFARLGGAAALALPQLIYKQFAFFINPLYRLGATLLVGAGLGLIGLIAAVIIAVMDKYREAGLKTEKVKRKMITLDSLKQFDKRFWLVVNLTLYHSIIYAFTGIGQGFFVQKYGLSLETASIANSLVFSATILATPVMGYIVNAIGYHILWTIGGIISGLIVHIILLASNPGLTYVPYITGTIYSISFTMATAAYWPIPGLIVDENQIATAYGIISSAINLYWGILAIVTGIIIDNIGYLVLETVYTLLMFLVVMVAVLVLMIDLTSEEPLVTAPGTCKTSPKKL